MTEWNVVLRGGPRDGILMQVRDKTNRIVSTIEDCDYVRTDEVEDGRIIFRWEPVDYGAMSPWPDPA